LLLWIETLQEIHSGLIVTCRYCHVNNKG